MSGISIPFHPGARLTGVYYFHSPRRRTVSRREGQPAELVIMLGGTYQARTAGLNLVARPGDVVFWYPGQKRDEENVPERPTRCIAVYFTWPRAPADLPARIHDAAGVIRLLAVRLLTLKDDTMPPPAALWDAYLTTILAEYVRQAERSRSRLLARVNQYVEEHLTEAISLAGLARSAGLERHHFCRQFRKETGETPMHYVRHRRVEHALGMLATSPDWITRRIAPRVGIADEAQLRRLLRRFTGLGVRELKRLARAREPMPFIRRVTRPEA